MKRLPQRALQASAAALTVAAISAATIGFSAQAREDTPARPGQAMLVLDASGSMWAQMNTPEGKKTTRIETARETISAMLDDLPADIELGLIAYGHRRKGDCKDIQTLLAPGKLDKDAFRSTVNKLNPKGMTPLTDAVRQAADALRYTEQKATVILVTDGLETCAPDPCAAASALEDAGIDFTAHVIGFGLSREESEKVACIAENTGGKYLEAKDAAGLSDALGEVVLEPAEPMEMEPHPERGPWYEGAVYMENVQLYPTGMTVGFTSENNPEAVEIPEDGTPQQCQAACDADQYCGAWVYEPAGSNFVPYARCHVFAPSSELYYEHKLPEDNWHSGIKEGVVVLTEPYTPKAAEE